MRVIRLFLIGTAFLIALPAFAASSLRVTVQPLPVQASIPQGAQRVPMQLLRFAASCEGPVTIESLILAHQGKGPTSDIARVYAWSNKRLSRAVVPQARDTFTVRMQPAITIPACKSADIGIVADYSATATIGSEHRIELVSVETTNDAFVTVQQAASAMRRTTPNAQASTVTAEFRNVLTPMKYGANRVLARLSLSARGTRDAQVTAITLTNEGSASDTDLQNFYWAKSNGDILSGTVPAMDGDTVRISFDPPLVVRSGNSQLIELRGDIRSGARKTIHWSIEEPSDVEAVDVRAR